MGAIAATYFASHESLQIPLVVSFMSAVDS